MAEFIRCHMRFEALFDGWRVDFVRDGHTVRTVTFNDDYKIWETARRGRSLKTLEDKNILELAIRNRRGGRELYLTPDEFGKLRRQHR